MGKRVVLVAAHGANRVIGNAGEIPWHLPEDFAHFKRVTLGHTLVMGRRTWESIGRPLPGRRTVVVTSDRGYVTGFDEVLLAHSLAGAVAAAAELPGDVVVAGGGEVYRQALPWATHMVLTEVAVSPVGDAWFPEFDAGEWLVTEERVGEGCVFRWLERKPVAALAVEGLDVPVVWGVGR